MLIKKVLLGRQFIEAKIDGGLFVISFHLILARHITTVYDLFLTVARATMTPMILRSVIVRRLTN